MARTCVILLLLALAAVWTGSPAGGEDEAPVPTGEVRGALTDLQSPAERTRDEAVRRLIAALPQSRRAVIEALSRAAPAVTLHLVEVLAADGSLPAIEALLRAMAKVDDALAIRIRRVLVRSEHAPRKVLDAWKEKPALRLGVAGETSQRANDLERMLRRAEVERLFVSRKSRTGSTGSYRGQYEVLKPYRETALELCIAIIKDRALPEPGVFTAGTFTFLRPLSTPIDVYELMGMATHAFSELARPTDVMPLAELTSFLAVLREHVDEAYYDEVALPKWLHRYADLLVALALVRPDRFGRQLQLFLNRLENNSSWEWALGSSYHALVLLRIGRYAEATDELDDLLVSGSARSTPAGHYNLACAYAQWGAQIEDALLRSMLLDKALDHLETAVEANWLDIGWMEEDRDLEPIRDTARYRKLAKRVREELGLDDDE